MTKLPRLYPGHQHQWANITCGRIHGFGEECNHSSNLVTCTVCGFQAPRNAAGLDGRIPDPADDGVVDAVIICGYVHTRGDGTQSECSLPENHGGAHYVLPLGAYWHDPQPEQETRA